MELFPNLQRLHLNHNNYAGAPGTPLALSRQASSCFTTPPVPSRTTTGFASGAPSRQNTGVSSGNLALRVLDLAEQAARDRGVELLAHLMHFPCPGFAVADAVGLGAALGMGSGFGAARRGFRTPAGSGGGAGELVGFGSSLGQHLVNPAFLDASFRSAGGGGAASAARAQALLAARASGDWPGGGSGAVWGRAPVVPSPAALLSPGDGSPRKASPRRAGAAAGGSPSKAMPLNSAGALLAPYTPRASAPHVRVLGGTLGSTPGGHALGGHALDMRRSTSALPAMSSAAAAESCLLRYIATSLKVVDVRGLSLPTWFTAPDPASLSFASGMCAKPASMIIDMPARQVVDRGARGFSVDIASGPWSSPLGDRGAAKEAAAGGGTPQQQQQGQQQGQGQFHRLGTQSSGQGVIGASDQQGAPGASSPAQGQGVQRPRVRHEGQGAQGLGAGSQDQGQGGPASSSQGQGQGQGKLSARASPAAPADTDRAALDGAEPGPGSDNASPVGSVAQHVLLTLPLQGEAATSTPGAGGSAAAAADGATAAEGAAGTASWLQHAASSPVPDALVPRRRGFLGTAAAAASPQLPGQEPSPLQFLRQGSGLSSGQGQGSSPRQTQQGPGGLYAHLAADSGHPVSFAERPSPTASGAVAVFRSEAPPHMLHEGPHMLQTVAEDVSMRLGNSNTRSLGINPGLPGLEALVGATPECAVICGGADSGSVGEGGEREAERGRGASFGAERADPEAASSNNCITSGSLVLDALGGTKHAPPPLERAAQVLPVLGGGPEGRSPDVGQGAGVGGTVRTPPPRGGLDAGYVSGPTLTGGPGAWGGDGKGTTDGGDDGGYFSGPNLVGGARAGAAPWGASPGPFMHQQYPQQYPQQYQQQQQYQPQQGGLRMGQYHGRRSSGVSAGPGPEAEAGSSEREKTACWRPPEVSLPTRWQLSLSVPGAVLDMTDLSWRRLPRGQQVSRVDLEAGREGGGGEPHTCSHE